MERTTSTRYSVVRYGNWYAVVDLRDEHHRHVEHTRSRARAHAMADALNERDTVRGEGA